MAEKFVRLPRPFLLVRDIDETGISGTGVVARGCQFADGVCVLTWLTQHTSTAIYASIAEVRAIHGHDGKTRIEWPLDTCSAGYRDEEGRLFQCAGDPGHKGDHGDAGTGYRWGPDTGWPPLDVRSWGAVKVDG